MINKFEEDYFNFYNKTLSIRKLRDNLLSRVIKNNAKGQTCLDVGCGYGDLLSKLNKHDFRLYGIDISNFAIRKAKKTYPQINFKVADVQKVIPFKIKFDVILAIDVIEHLRNPLKALKNIRSKIKKGGILFIQMPFVSNLLNKWVNKKFLSIDKTHIFIPSLNDFLRMTGKAGFKPIKFYSSPLFFIRLPKKLATISCLTLVVLKAV